MEGESNVFIPCTTCVTEGRQSTPFWRINGNDFFNFDQNSFYYSTQGGLLINKIHPIMNGTKFQCVLPAENGHPMQFSCQGLLIVNVDSGKAINVKIATMI